MKCPLRCQHCQSRDNLAGGSRVRPRLQVETCSRNRIKCVAAQNSGEAFLLAAGHLLGNTRFVDSNGKVSLETRQTVSEVGATSRLREQRIACKELTECVESQVF